MSEVTEASIRERMEARPMEYIFSRSEVDFLLGLVSEIRRINYGLNQQIAVANRVHATDVRLLEEEIAKLRREVDSAQQVLAAFVSDTDDDAGVGTW